MKPYNKDFLFEEIDKYEDIIHEQNCGNFKIIKNSIPKGKTQGYIRKTGIDTLDIATDKPYIDGVRALFKRRARKR